METKKTYHPWLFVLWMFACVFCLMAGALWLGKIFHKPNYKHLPIVMHLEAERYPAEQHEKWDGRDARLEYEKACERIREGTDTQKDHETWADYTRDNTS